MGTGLRTTIASGAGAAVLLLAPAVGASPAPPRAPEPHLRYRESYRLTRADGARGRYRAVLRVGDAGDPGGEAPTVLRVGRLSFEVPAGRRRARERNEDGAWSARLRRRGERVEVRLRGTIRDWTGSPLGDGYLDYRTAPAYGLEEVTLERGSRRWSFALGLAGQCDPLAGPYGDPWGVRLRGGGLAAGAAAATGGGTVLRLCPPEGSGEWTGRVAGQVLSRLPGVRLSLSLDGGPWEPVEAQEERSVEVDGTLFHQVVFDAAVPAPPGPHRVAVRASGTGASRQARADRRFTAPATRPPVALDAGGGAILEIRGDGRIWAWGENLFGEVGDGTFRPPFSPVPLREPADAVSVASSDDFSLAVDGTGTVWFWGDRERSREGDGWGIDTAVGGPHPETVSLPGRALQVSAGYEHAAVLLEDGTVRTWGWTIPRVVNGGGRVSREGFLPGAPAIDGVTAVDCGDSHVLCLRRDGSVWTWEAPEEGIPSPESIVRVEGLPPVVQVAGGWGWSAAVDREGGVWTWGANDAGQLGDGTTIDRVAPARVPGLPRIRQVAAGDEFALAVDAAGNVWSWGDNDSGQLGDGSEVARPFPLRVPGIAPAVSVAAGWWTSLAALEDGSVWIWGLHPRVEGHLGDGGVAPRLYPREFVPGHDPVPVAVLDLRDR